MVLFQFMVKVFSIEQFAEDTKGLLDVLKINKSDVLGYSMGGMIAQELTLNHADKVDDLIIMLLIVVLRIYRFIQLKN